MGIFDQTLSELFAPFGSARVTPYRGEDFGDGLQVTEISDVTRFDPDASSGVGIGENPTLFLKGTRLPKQPFTWGGKQRITKEYYAGNPEPSMQILGSSEDNVTLEGRWHDKRGKVSSDFDVYNNDVYGIAYRLQEYFDALRRRGNLIYLRLGDWERYGYIEEIEFRMKTLGDIEWRLNFSVIGKDKPAFNFFAETLQEIPLDLAVKLAVAASDVTTIPNIPYPGNILSAISEAVSSLAAQVSAVTKFVDGVLSLAEKTVAQVQKCILLVRNLRAEISRFKRRIGQLAVDISDISSIYNDREKQKWVDAITKSIRDIQHKPSQPVAVADAQSKALAFLSRESSKTQSGSIRSTPSLETMLARLDSQLKAISRTIAMARHRVQDGDTLARLAIRYYKDAEQWKRIYDHNRLQSTVLVSGSVLEVPRL